MPIRKSLSLALLTLILLAAGCSSSAPMPSTRNISHAPLAGAAPAHILADLAPVSAPQTLFRVQTANDLSLDDLIVTQAVDNEPLILNKDTVVRAVVGSTYPSPTDATVTVQFDGKTFTQTASVQGPKTEIDVYVGAPENFHTQTITAQVAPAQGTDADASNNLRTVTSEMVKPNEHLIAFFLPVDWTPDQQSRYHFDTAFPNFVQKNLTYLSGTYPLGKDQIQVTSTMTPHMLAANEKHLANNQGQEDSLSLHLLYASISLAARRQRPDATLVVGVFPPGWFAEHGNRDALGLALADVKGTVTAQYVLTDATASAHELAHLYWMYEDYDFSTSPPHPFTWVDRSGFFVQSKIPEIVSDVKQIPTFLSAYDPDQPSWVDTRIYEYLTAKFTIETGGEVTAPMLLAATMARHVQPDGEDDPSDYAAGYQRFDSDGTVNVSVAAAGMKGGETLEARWFQGDQQISTEQKTLNPGNDWYAFSLHNPDGLDPGSYHVDLYLDGKLQKTDQFEVRS